MAADTVANCSSYFRSKALISRESSRFASVVPTPPRHPGASRGLARRVRLKIATSQRPQSRRGQDLLTSGALVTAAELGISTIGGVQFMELSRT